MKQMQVAYNAIEKHWVGDGFTVRRLFYYKTLGDKISPFLMLDFAWPAEFGPADRPRGIGMHSHCGF